MRIEEQHTDVLQNLEHAVISLFRRNPSMTDYAVLRVYEALVEHYTAESAGRASRTGTLTGLEAQLFESARTICEWRLGRRKLGAESDEGLQPVDVPTMILCLKRLAKSVQKWTRESGRQGYLTFVAQFVE